MMYDATMWVPRLWQLELESWNKLERISWIFEADKLESWKQKEAGSWKFENEEEMSQK